MKKTILALLLLSPVFGAGCADFATTRNFAAMGTVLGTGAGVALGAATGHVAEGAMLGAALGGLGGGMAGSAADNYGRKKAQQDLLKGVQQDMLTGKIPSSGTPAASQQLAGKTKWVDTSRKKRVWVEEKVVAGKIISAHFDERLIPSGHWENTGESGWARDPASQAAPIP